MTPDRLRLAAFVAGSALLGALAGWLRREGPGAIGRHLDRTIPDLEDSTELLAAEPEDLPGVARRQRERTVAVLEGLESRGLLPWGPVVRGLLVCALGGALAAGIDWARERTSAEERTAAAVTGEAPVVTMKEGLVVTAVRHRVQPPRYTGQEAFEAAGLAVRFPAGSDVAWRVEIAGPVAAAYLETPADQVALREASPGRWVVQRRVHDSVAYRLVLEGREGARLTTPWTRLEAVPDRPPEVRIVAPDRLVERGPAELAPLPVTIELEDDYGTGPAELVATLALGAGEMVEFREERSPLGWGEGTATRREIRTTLDLRSLGLAAGGELYFRVESLDNRQPGPQPGRSATRIVRVRSDRSATAELGAGLPLVTPPDLFRSQRQIILDTEALIAERPRLAREEVVRRSEGIGFDQRALRMRYGILLGDEFVSGAAVEAELHDEEHAPQAHEEAGPGEALEGLPAGLVHTHDSAEMATFFPDAIRTALRQALGAMWEAEEALRAVEPDSALPHEIRALEGLQEIRRQSRVYVQRVGFDPPPLDPEEARWRGELDEILRPRRRVADARAEPAAAVVAYRLLTAGTGDREALRSALDAAGDELAARAVDLPGVGLEGLGALAEVRDAVVAGEAPPAGAVREALRALWALAPAPPARPARRVDPFGPRGDPE
jgi:hypothetical protein